VAARLEPLFGQRAPDIAERLIRGFGSLGRALAASVEQLTHALDSDRDAADAIVAARQLVEAALHEQISREPVRATSAGYRAYLGHTIGSRTEECLHVTFVTSDLGYLGDEILARGNQGQVSASLRQMVRRALDLGAAGVILAHNHPSGSVSPSAGDIALTRSITAILQALDICLLDHLVVSRDAAVSMRERGLI